MCDPVGDPTPIPPLPPALAAIHEQARLRREYAERQAETVQRMRERSAVLESLRPDWVAAVDGVEQAIAPIFASVDPTPDDRLHAAPIAAALKRWGEVLVRYDRLPWVQEAAGLDPVAWLPQTMAGRLDQVAHLADNFDTTRPPDAACLVRGAMDGTVEMIGEAVRVLLDDRGRRPAFGWLRCIAASLDPFRDAFNYGASAALEPHPYQPGWGNCATFDEENRLYYAMTLSMSAITFSKRDLFRWVTATGGESPVRGQDDPSPAGHEVPEDLPVAESVAIEEVPPDGERIGAGAPSVPLVGWAEIVNALNELHGPGTWKNDDDTREKLKGLNKHHDGPIRSSGRGGKPTVGKRALLGWMTKLGDDFERRAEETDQARESAKLTAAVTHNYGRTGVVAPELNGDVHKSRSRRRRS